MELILLLTLVLIVFGPGKLPEIGKAVGKGMKEFRRASSDLEETLKGEVVSTSADIPSAGKLPK
jgi:sec-independent protein translocase protein TatA